LLGGQRHRPTRLARPHHEYIRAGIEQSRDRPARIAESVGDGLTRIGGGDGGLRD
jgi:hypothetical protein